MIQLIWSLKHVPFFLASLKCFLQSPLFIFKNAASRVGTTRIIALKQRKTLLLLLLKYLNLINEMSRNYRCVRFINLSMSSLGVFSDECSTFLDMMNDIGIDKKQQRYIIKKMINIGIRATYYIFCCRKRN